MIATVSLFIAGLAFVVSAFTAWATLLRRGTLKMSQPNVIYFGPDAAGKDKIEPAPKVFLRSILFSTGKRGCVIESMYARVKRNETVQNFSIWVYGEDRLARGSGLFVGENGVTTNHHFLTPRDGSIFAFVAGIYTLEVYAKVLGSSSDIQLFSQELSIPKELEIALQVPHAGLYFDWSPNSHTYLPHIETKPPQPNSLESLELLRPPEEK